MSFLVLILFSVSFAASAQIYVKIRPPVPVIVRPPQPSHSHIWINEEWEPNNGSYRYSGGHWAKPPHPHYVRRAGYWKHHHHDGDVWVQGTWIRKG